MSMTVNTRPGRYAELSDGELADTVERTYEQGGVADWELVLELTRRLVADPPV